MTVLIRERLLALGFAGLITLGVSPAGAQNDVDNQPLVIIPLGDSETLGGASSTDTSGSGLVVESLAPVSADAAGSLDAAAGGLGMDLWRDSDGQLIGVLLPRIPGGTGSQVMTNLGRRLLLSAARAPEGDTGDFLGWRIDRLIALGLQNDVPDLIASAGQQALTTLGHKGRIDALLLAGEQERACQAARDAVVTGDDVNAALTLIFCQRLAGQDAAADLGLQILRDTGAEFDERFLVLDQALASGQPASVETLEDASPLLLAMALSSGTRLSANLLESAPAPVLRAVAAHDALPLETRLTAAEAAVAAGAMRGEELGALYDTASFSADQITNALSRADTTTGPLGRALLYQAASQQSLPVAKAEALAGLLRHAAGEGGQKGFLAAARVSGPMIAGLTPGTELAWFSGDASMVLLAAGMPEVGARWWPLLEDRARNDAVAAAQVAALWPMFRLAFGEQLPDDGTRMRSWWDASARIAPDRVARQAEIYLALLAALDDRAAQSLMVEALATPPVLDAAEEATSDSGVLLAFEVSVDDGKLGESMLLALIALGPDGPAGADPIVLRTVVRGLKQLGFGREARLIALEAAFANGT
jgi:hypothetical protein